MTAKAKNEAKRRITEAMEPGMLCCNVEATLPIICVTKGDIIKYRTTW